MHNRRISGQPTKRKQRSKSKTFLTARVMKVDIWQGISLMPKNALLRKRFFVCVSYHEAAAAVYVCVDASVQYLTYALIAVTSQTVTQLETDGK